MRTIQNSDGKYRKNLVLILSILSILFSYFYYASIRSLSLSAPVWYVIPVLVVLSQYDACKHYAMRKWYEDGRNRLVMLIFNRFFDDRLNRLSKIFFFRFSEIRFWFIDHAKIEKLILNSITPLSGYQCKSQECKVQIDICAQETFLYEIQFWSLSFEPFFWKSTYFW